MLAYGRGDRGLGGPALLCYLGDREDVDPAFLFLHLTHEHRRPDQQQVCHAISVHIHRAQDAPEVRPDLRQPQARLA